MTMKTPYIKLLNKLERIKINKCSAQETVRRKVK